MKPRLSRGFFLADAHDASHFEAGALGRSWALPPWRSWQGVLPEIPPDRTARLRCGSFAFRRLRRIQNWRSSSSLYRLHCGLIPIETGRTGALRAGARGKDWFQRRRQAKYRSGSGTLAPLRRGAFLGHSKKPRLGGRGFKVSNLRRSSPPVVSARGGSGRFIRMARCLVPVNVNLWTLVSNGPGNGCFENSKPTRQGNRTSRAATAGRCDCADGGARIEAQLGCCCRDHGSRAHRKMLTKGHGA